MATSLEIFDDAGAFLAVAAEHLAKHPVLSTVVASVAHGEARLGSRAPEAAEALKARGPPADPPHWYAVVRGAAGAVVGVAMRTAPFEPHPLFVLPMSDEAAVALARLLHDAASAWSGSTAPCPRRACWPRRRRG